MNAPRKPPPAFVPIPWHRKSHPPAIAAALKRYDAAKGNGQRHRALADIARARAEHRNDLGAEAQRLIDGLAARWTAWRSAGP